MSNEESIDYMGVIAPRFQSCAFCHKNYDALLGDVRPHAVCNECWPEVSRIEREHSEENPIIRNDYVLEWSQSQKSFHIETMEEAMEGNREALKANRQSDWIILFANRTHAEAKKIADVLKRIQCEAMQELREKWGPF